MSTQKKRIDNAKIIESSIRFAIQPTGLEMTEFSYPLVGKLEFAVKIDCEDKDQLREIYEIMENFIDTRNFKIARADVSVVPDWYRVVFVLELTE